MDPDRTSPATVTTSLRGFAKVFQGLKNAALRRSNRRGQVRRYAMPGQLRFHAGQAAVLGLHHVMTRAPVNMKINESWSQDQIRKVKRANAGRDFDRAARLHIEDGAIFHHHDGSVEPLLRSDETACSDDCRHGFKLFTTACDGPASLQRRRERVLCPNSPADQ